MQQQLSLFTTPSFIIDQPIQECNSLKELKVEASSCQRCSLHTNRKEVCFSRGSVENKIMVVGEAPGKEEDLSGNPFVGQAGKLYDKCFMNILGIDTWKSFYTTNTVKCRPPENRVPSKVEKKTCFQFLKKEVEIVNPDVIVTLGKSAFITVMGQVPSSMHKVVGKVEKARDLLGNRKVLSLYHPAACLYNKNLTQVFEQHIKTHAFLFLDSIRR